jgi:glucose-6-phosphate isomerase
MQQIRFNFNNMFAHNVGRKHGITEADLKRSRAAISCAHGHFRAAEENPRTRLNVSMEWLVLPFQDKKAVGAVQKLGDEITFAFENVISLGIGGSYLGLKAAQESLAAPYYNEFSSCRGKRARIYFEGNNLDPTPLKTLLKELDPKKTFVVVISKSGETTETKAAFDIVEAWLRAGVGRAYGHQVVAITDPVSGSLRRRVDEEQKKDAMSFRSLALLGGVGGRYSEFNMGLLHLAMIGVDIQDVLDGAKAMAQRCSRESIFQNPAYMYAVLHHLAYMKKGKPIAILMPFTELLTSVADWYCQLLAESTGKRFARKIMSQKDGSETWAADTRRPLYVGRTPVPTRGTTDLHSIQQNNVEGENDKTVTMIRVERFKNDLTVPAAGGILAGKALSELLSLAQEATEWALVRNQRPNCTISMSEITPWTWGGLLYFFEMATAFEGELLNINAFDQPGVESYKNYMYHKLGKPGMPEAVAKEIEKYPVKCDPKYIL